MAQLPLLVVAALTPRDGFLVFYWVVVIILLILIINSIRPLFKFSEYSEDKVFHYIMIVVAGVVLAFMVIAPFMGWLPRVW